MRFMLIRKADADTEAGARKWPTIDSEADVEIRQLFDAEDFGDNFTPALQEREAHLREQAAVSAND
jgi:hypothetical protein